MWLVTTVCSHHVKYPTVTWRSKWKIKGNKIQRLWQQGSVSASGNAPSVAATVSVGDGMSCGIWSSSCVTMSEGVGEGGAGLLGNGALIEKEEVCEGWEECVSEPTMAAEKYNGVGGAGSQIGSGTDSSKTQDVVGGPTGSPRRWQCCLNRQVEKWTSLITGVGY